MEEDHEECITGLSLGLGTGGNNIGPKNKKQKLKKLPVGGLNLAIELCSNGETNINMNIDHNNNKVVDSFCLQRIDEGHHGYPNEKIISTATDDSNNKNDCRKKLRLTKEQSAMLESSFKLHSTLNSVQKQALADQLNLKTRQIEVWFQNRRARTKLKQTEVDCEFLKKCCQSLTDENRRLKRELQELRALKVGPSPLYIQLSKAATTLTMCSSCEKIVKPHEPNNTSLAI